MSHKIAYLILGISLTSCNISGFMDGDTSNEKKSTTSDAKLPAEIDGKKETLASYLRSLDMTSARVSAGKACGYKDEEIMAYPTASEATSGSAIKEPSLEFRLSTPEEPINGAPERACQTGEMVAMENADGTLSKCDDQGTGPVRPPIEEPGYCGEAASIKLQLCINEDRLEISNAIEDTVKNSCFYLSCSFYDDSVGDDGMVFGSDSSATVSSDGATKDADPTVTSSEGILKVPYKEQHGRFECYQYSPGSSSIDNPGDTDSKPPVAGGEEPSEPNPTPIIDRCPQLNLPAVECKDDGSMFVCEAASKGINGTELNFQAKGSSICGMDIAQRQDVIKQACENKLFDGNFDALGKAIACRPIK